MRINRRTFATSIASLPLLNVFTANAQTGTPASPVSDLELAEASSRVTTLCRYIPGGILDDTLDLIWVDPERQLFHLSRTADDLEGITAYAQSQFGAMPILFEQILNIEAEMGFGAVNIRQVVSSGVLPNSSQIIALDLDAAKLIESWSELGYEERENKFGSFWTIGEEAEFDFDHPIQKLVLASFNNVALVDEHTLAFTQTASMLEQIMGTVAEDSPSILDGLAPVNDGLPEAAISAWYVEGENLAFDASDGILVPEQVEKLKASLGDSDAAAGVMPEIRTVCTGTTEGAARDENLNDPQAVAYAVLELERDAETAAAVIEWRHKNMTSQIAGRPYSDVIGDLEIEVYGDRVVRLTSHDSARGARFTQMVNQRDILLFTYGY